MLCIFGYGVGTDTVIAVECLLDELEIEVELLQFGDEGLYLTCHPIL